MSSRKRRRAQRRNLRLTGVALAAVLLVAVVATDPPGSPAGAVGGHYAATPAESITDIQAFWTEALPDTYGRTYQPLPAERVHPYTSTDPPPGCGTRGRTPYREVAGNAFYCEQGDFVAYDAEQLIPTLEGSYGDFAVGLVLAHEWGHAVQGRVGAPDGAFVYTELQADCFAGAWARRIATGSGTRLRLSDDDLDRALAGFLALRDPSGVDGRQEGAHGNAFDRVSALQDGLEGGADACRAYGSRPPEVTEEGYRSAADAAINGDLPLDEVLPMLERSLDDYWTTAVRAYDEAPQLVAVRSTGAPACTRSDGGVLSDTVVYCADSNRIVYASSTLTKASTEIGDLGAGVFVAAAWSSAVQHDLGQALGTNRSRATAECLTGAWAGAMHRGTTASRSARFALSPGDLDEVIAAFVATDDAQSEVNRGSVFDRVTLFRAGFDGGTAACLAV